MKNLLQKNYWFDSWFPIWFLTQTRRLKKSMGVTQLHWRTSLIYQGWRWWWGWKNPPHNFWDDSIHQEAYNKKKAPPDLIPDLSQWSQQEYISDDVCVCLCVCVKNSTDYGWAEMLQHQHCCSGRNQARWLGVSGGWGNGLQPLLKGCPPIGQHLHNVRPAIENTLKHLWEVSHRLMALNPPSVCAPASNTETKDVFHQILDDSLFFDPQGWQGPLVWGLKLTQMSWGNLTIANIIFKQKTL